MKSIKKYYFLGIIFVCTFAFGWYQILTSGLFDFLMNQHNPHLYYSYRKVLFGIGIMIPSIWGIIEYLKFINELTDPNNYYKMILGPKLERNDVEISRKKKKTKRKKKKLKQFKNLVKLNLLLRESLIYKWNFQLTPEDIDQFCSFCRDTMNKGDDFQNCKKCLCPKPICDGWNEKSKGFAYEMGKRYKRRIFDEYEYIGCLKADLVYMRMLFQREIKKTDKEIKELWRQLK